MSKIKSEIIDKFLQSFILISGSIWLGSQITKIMTIYYFFQSDEYGRIFLKQEILIDIINLISYQLLPLFSVSIFSYTAFIIFVIVYTFYIRKKIKLMGWLFISLSIIYLCLPFEIYLTLIDIELFEYLLNRIGESTTIIALFEKRIQTLSSFPIISITLHLAIFILMVFKPLDKRGKIEN